MTNLQLKFNDIWVDETTWSTEILAAVEQLNYLKETKLGMLGDNRLDAVKALYPFFSGLYGNRVSRYGVDISAFKTNFKTIFSLLFPSFIIKLGYLIDPLFFDNLNDITKMGEEVVRGTTGAYTNKKNVGFSTTPFNQAGDYKWEARDIAGKKEAADSTSSNTQNSNGVATDYFRNAVKTQNTRLVIPIMSFIHEFNGLFVQFEGIPSKWVGGTY